MHTVTKDFTGVTLAFAGPRVSVRTMEETDATQEYANWLCDPEVNQYLATKHATVDGLKDYIAEKNQKADALFFGIFLNENDKHIGTVKLEPIELEKKSTTIGVMLGNKACWGKGYAGEAMQLLIDWCFNELGCTEIILGAVSENAAAIRLYSKLGFKEVKRVPADLHYGDQIFDRIWMALKKQI